MDLKICIWFILLLAIGQARGYIKCLEMQQETDRFQGKSCTVEEMSDDFFLKNKFYIAESADSIQHLHITAALLDIPEGIGNIFTHLTSLDLATSGLKNLQKKSLERVPANVQILKIGFSKYTTLSDDMFTGVSGLRFLDMSYGSIEQIHDKAFAKLSDLTTLDLKRNFIKTITKEMFDELPNLEFLDLSYNLLSISLEPGIFGGCPKLEQLRIIHNQLTAVKAGFVSAMRLNELSLSKNRLTVFDIGSLVVEELDVQHNNLTELYIPASTFKLNATGNQIRRLTCGKHLSIVELGLANNSISSMDCIGNASALRNLELTNNNIGKINNSTFAQLSELRELRLGHTKLSNFVRGVLNQQAHLEVLDLSYNQLGDFPMEILLNSKQLTHLYIDGNNMTDIPVDEISAIFKSLQVLGIGGNNLDCEDLVIMLAKLEKSLPGCKVETMFNDVKMNRGNVRGIGCESHNKTITPDLKSLAESISIVRGEIESLKSQMSVHLTILVIVIIVVLAVIGASGYVGYKQYRTAQAVYKRFTDSQGSSGSQGSIPLQPLSTPAAQPQATSSSSVEQSQTPSDPPAEHSQTKPDTPAGESQEQTEDQSVEQSEVQPLC